MNGWFPSEPSGFLKAAAAFLVNRTAVRRLTPDGEPVRWAPAPAPAADLTGVTGNVAGATRLSRSESIIADAASWHPMKSQRKIRLQLVHTGKHNM